MKKSLIIARIVGGIGNQIFTYAAARRLALLNNAELVLDDTSGFKYDQKFKRYCQLDKFNIPCRRATRFERLEPFSLIRRYLLRRWNKLFPFECRKYLTQEGLDFDSRLIYYRPKGRVHFEGYWQSENYFKDIEETIRMELEIKPPEDYVNRNLADEIVGRTAVAVHVRFFNDNDTHVSYYHRSISEMECRVPDAHYYLFSDKPGLARQLVPLADNRVTVVDHNQGDAMAYADLWLMTLCRHFIIANSTFSWWGAWLCSNKEKIIIAPGFEKRDGDGSWGFKGLLPECWEKY